VIYLEHVVTWPTFSTLHSNRSRYPTKKESRVDPQSNCETLSALTIKFFPLYDRIWNTNRQICKKKPALCFGHTSFVSLQKSEKNQNICDLGHKFENVTNLWPSQISQIVKSGHRFGVTGTSFSKKLLTLSVWIQIWTALSITAPLWNLPAVALSWPTVTQAFKIKVRPIAFGVSFDHHLQFLISIVVFQQNMAEETGRTGWLIENWDWRNEIPNAGCISKTSQFPCPLPI